MQSFGQRLAMYRRRAVDPDRRRGLSQERLGELLGGSRSVTP